MPKKKAERKTNFDIGLLIIIIFLIVAVITVCGIFVSHYL